MTKPLKLSRQQVLLLCTILPRPLTPQDAAFQVCSSTSGATRTMISLSNKGLAYTDVPNAGAGHYCWVPSEAGVQWVQENRSRVEEVHVEEGFALSDVASMYGDFENTRKMRSVLPG